MNPDNAILLTGAAGYLGQRLLPCLPASSRIYCLQHTTAVAIPPGMESRCARVSADLADPASLGAVFTPEIQVVVHLAAMSRAAPAVLDRVNVQGTRHLLAAAQNAGVRHFVFCSSQDAVHAVRTRYGDSKQAAERLVRDSGLPYTILRPGLVYGARGGALEYLARFAARTHLYPRPGSGRQPWQPVHVDDLAGLLARLVAAGPMGTTLDVVGSAVLPQRDVLRAVMEAQGIHALPVPLPLWLLDALRPLLRASPSGLEMLDKLRLNAGSRTARMAPLPEPLQARWRGFPDGLE